MNICGLLFVALALIASTASAQTANDLVNAINVYRSAPQACEGTRSAAAAALAPNPALASQQLASGDRLLDALQARGYRAATAHVIMVSGPTSAGAVMKFIEPRSCRPLSSPQYTEIGVRRDADHWQIVLARPLLSPELRGWRETGREIMRLTNAARAAPRACGNRRFAPVPPLEWDDRLAAAALAHSGDMANRNYLDHLGKDGSEPAGRVRWEGYDWQDVGENIAAGQGFAAEVVAGWLSSPVHCANIMNTRFVQMGAAYAVNPASDAGIYWTHVFGKPR